MATKAPEPVKSIVKREPVLMLSGAWTVAQTVLFVLPAFGVKLPDKVTKPLALAGTIVAALGIRSLVKPA